MRPALLMSLVGVSVLLAACQQAAERPEQDACGASGYGFLLGQNRDVLAAMTFPAPMRAYGEGDPVTLDFNPARLNVVWDETGEIIAVSCG